MARQTSRDIKTIPSHAIKLQSAMEYLMTYGWAILIIAIIITIIFALGLFNGVPAPTSCVAQLSYTCSNPSYTANAVSFTFGQSSGKYYYSVNAFVASESLGLEGNGRPANMSLYSYAIGSLAPGQTVIVTFNSLPQGGIQPNAPVSTPLSAYVWIGYCTNPMCAGGAQYAKVAAMNVQASGSTALSGGPSPTSTPSTSTSTTITSTTSTTTTTASTTTINYVAIMLTNAQSTPTPLQFQQNLTIDNARYNSANEIDSTWSNVEFSSGNTIANGGTPLQAWIERNPTNSGMTMVWVNMGLTQVPANGGSATIYMNFMPNSILSASGPTGEAPQLSPTYAEYDNGANVFTGYWNFAGTSMPSGWTTGLSGLVINNGISCSCSGSPATIYTSMTYGTVGIAEAYTESTGAADIQIDVNGTNFGYFTGIHMYSSQFYMDWADSPSPPNVGSASFNTWYVVSLLYDAVSATGLINYQNPGFSTYSGSIRGGIAPSILSNGAFELYWYRIRAYPPNGVMPSVTFGSVQ